jgi:hypothetical protein
VGENLFRLFLGLIPCGSADVFRFWKTLLPFGGFFLTRNGCVVGAVDLKDCFVVPFIFIVLAGSRGSDRRKKMTKLRVLFQQLHL